MNIVDRQLESKDNFIRGVSWPVSAGVQYVAAEVQPEYDQIRIQTGSGVDHWLLQEFNAVGSPGAMFSFEAQSFVDIFAQIRNCAYIDPPGQSQRRTKHHYTYADIHFYQGYIKLYLRCYYTFNDVLNDENRFTMTYIFTPIPGPEMAEISRS